MKLTDREWCWITLICCILTAGLVMIIGQGIYWVWIFFVIAFFLLLGLFGGNEDEE